MSAGRPMMMPPSTDPLVRSFLDHPAQRRLAASSRRDKRRTVTTFGRFLAPQPLLEATVEDVERWLRAQTLTVGTQTTYLGALFAFFEWARAAGLCEANPVRPFRSGRRTLAESLAFDASVLDEQSAPPLAELVKVYVTDRLRRGEITELTARNLRCTLAGFARIYGDEPVGALEQVHVEEWLASIGHLAPATRRSQLSEVKTFSAWLARRRFVAVDPAAEVAKVRLPRYLPRGLDPSAVAKLLAACPDERGQLIVLLMAQEGLRCVEAARLQFHDLSFTDRTILVTGKGGHQRLLPLSDETWQALERYLDAHPASAGPLLRSYRAPEGLRPDTLSGMVSEWMGAAGVKRRSGDRISAHALRHTCATDMLRNGAHLRDVQAALGHASLSTTQVYLPAIVGDLREAMGGRSYRKVKVDPPEDF